MNPMAAESWHLVDRVPPLGPDDVHVWQARLVSDHEHLESTLPPEEVVRADRFYNPRDRRRYVVGRGCLRRLLGEYLSIPPATVALTATGLGKPFLTDGQSGIRFNVAHSEDLGLFAFARGREVGVDVERERSDLNWQELAQQNFAAEERESLTSQVGIFDRREAFFRCWTRKEAYIKALGLGMQVPLDRFAVTFELESAALLHTAHDPTQYGRWTLRGLSPAAGFAAALAVEGQNWRLFCAQRIDFQ
jgi:4'-phosphopantetheinyl transferase